MTFAASKVPSFAFAWFLLALFFASECPAVQPYTPVHPDPVLEPWRWRAFPELNGLGLRCMAEAKDGAMWFGVDTGVVRYDGVTWTTFTEKDGLYGAPVTALLGVRDGSVYAGTPLGVSRFRDGRWEQVFPLEGGLQWHIRNLMEASDGSVWAGSYYWGALRLNQSGATLYTAAATGDSLKARMPGLQFSIVPDGAVPDASWPEGSGAMVLRPESMHGPRMIWALSPGGPAEAAGLKLGDLILAADGQSDIPQTDLDGPAGTSVTLTVHREGRAEPFRATVTRQKVVGTHRVFGIDDIYEDREGRIWFGLTSGEILRWDRGVEPDDSAAWRLYTKADGLDIGVSPRILQTQDGILWTISRSPFQGVNRFDGSTWTHFRLSDLQGDNHNTAILETEDGALWIGGHENFCSLHVFRDGIWTLYKISEIPVPGNYVIGLWEASDGALWIAGEGQEAVRLDYGTDRWTTFEGLMFQCETPDGAQWFISRDGEAKSGVVRYNGREWIRYGVEDGLMNRPGNLVATRSGEVWATGSHDSTAATARFNPGASPGQAGRWSLKVHPELSWSISPPYESAEGRLWFSAIVRWNSRRGQVGGLLEFDPSAGPGKDAWTHHRAPTVPSAAYGIGQTADGALWFGGTYGLRRFDGQTWTVVTEPKELSQYVDVVYATSDKHLWVGSRLNGVFHYDGRVWTQYDEHDGLTDNSIRDILQTNDGSVWVGTRKGFSRFDGQTWTSHALPAEFYSDYGWGIRQSRDGAIWVNQWRVESGAFKFWTIRYAPDTVSPETEITLSVSEVSQPGNTTIAWKGIDAWKATADEEIQYAYRMDGGEWSAFSIGTHKTLLALGSGKYTFEVKARDRDFNEDPTPAMMAFTVVPPVWQQAWFILMVVLFIGAVSVQTTRIVRRDRRLRESNAALSAANHELFGLNRQLQESSAALSAAQQQVIDELEKELRTAHDLQMNLMPRESPQVAGLDIAGVCMPAHHVGGDFYQYFHRDGNLIVALSDVTGKAMEAAIPAVMFSGILDSQMETGGVLEDVFNRLNRSLCRNLRDRKFICLVMGEFDLAAGHVRLSNGGCPYPYCYRANTGRVEEVAIDTYPLGIRADVAYQAIALPFGAGDCLAFCSDGIVEAENAAREPFGYVRTLEVVRTACAAGLSAEEITGQIVAAVNAFRGDAPQSDDMTCVVVCARQRVFSHVI